LSIFDDWSILISFQRFSFVRSSLKSSKYSNIFIYFKIALFSFYSNISQTDDLSSLCNFRQFLEIFKTITISCISKLYMWKHFLFLLVDDKTNKKFFVIVINVSSIIHIFSTSLSNKVFFCWWHNMSFCRWNYNNNLFCINEFHCIRKMTNVWLREKWK
jgi:hypothetical protein